MTPADLAEGRRLLSDVFSRPTYANSSVHRLSDWLWDNKDALLAEAEAAARLREENRILTARFADGFAAGVQSVVDRQTK